MKQTAVEWLALRYHHRQGYLSLEDIAKAKEMEKEQIKESFKDGVHEGVLTDINYLKCDNEAEYYYNETYKQ
jgi:hypothetical protein